jgi:hypothetical protein
MGRTTIINGWFACKSALLCSKEVYRVGYKEIYIYYSRRHWSLLHHAGYALFHTTANVIVFIWSSHFYIIGIFYSILLTVDMHTMYMFIQCYMLNTTVKKNSSILSQLKMFLLLGHVVT